MKKYFVTAAIITLITACGGNSGSGSSGKDSSSASSSASEDISVNPDYKAGLALISKNDCLTCHKISEKLVGPAYDEVAKKYAGNDTAIAYLAKKILSGGSGVWGQIPMTPHPNVSQADAEQMVKYVLLLKNQ